MHKHAIKMIFALAGVFLFAVATQAAEHLVINEIQLAGDGGASDEYVELYNPTASSVDLFGWSIQYKSSAGSYWQKLELPSAIIPPGGYYLVAHNKYSGGYSDLSHQNFGMASSGGNLYLVSSLDKLEIGYSDELIVDKVAWGSGNDPEVQAATGAPVAWTSINRSGGVDTDNNAADFSVQNSTPGTANISQQANEPEPDGQASPEEMPTGDPVNEDMSGQEAPAEEEENPIKDEEDSSSDGNLVSDDKNYKTTGNIIINELLPNPVGIDGQGEWIEIKSMDSETVDLTGWRLADLSRSYTLDSNDLGELLLDSGEFMLIKREYSGIALNNAGEETVSLFDSANQAVDSVFYGDDVDEGQAWARGRSGFAWTINPTPGWENIMESPVAVNDDFSDEDLDLETVQASDTGTAAASDSDGENGGATGSPNGLQDASASKADYSQLVISELIPDPVGDDEAGEWIELHNKGYQDIDLDGVMLGDNSGKVFQLSGATIEAGGYLVISREESKLTLNNDGDEVKLWSPRGEYLTATRYFGSAVEGEAYALGSSGLWDWTTLPTPGEENVFSQILGVESGGDELAIDRPYGSAKRSIKPNFLNNSSPDELAPTIEDIRNEPIGTPVTVRGTVVAEPGLFAKTYFYIADRRHGIRVYYSKGEFPQLNRGDFIEVSGEISQSNDELRVKISSPEDIELITSDGEPEPQEVELAEIGEQLEGSLVLIGGDITSIKSNNIYLDDFESEVRIYVADGTNIDVSVYQVGDTVQVTGVVSQTNAGFRVMPRNQGDIRPASGEVAGAAIEPVLVSNRGNNNTLLAYLVPLLAIILGGSFLLLNRRYHWVDFSKKQNPDS